jgi:hypothetical protein
MTTEYRYLSPEDRAAYQRELLHLLSTRNESLAKRWGVDRADRCFALKATLGDFRGVSLGGFREVTEHEFYLAGQELLAAIRKEVKA